MRIYNESNKIEGICRYDEAGNVIHSFDKRLVGRYTREARNLLPIGYLIRKTRSKKSNDYYIKSRRRGGTIAPNLSHNKRETGEVEL